MYESLSPVELSTGECVEAGLIQAPDREWVGILKCLILESTAEPWTWAAQHVLRFDTGAEVWCYILHRDSVPFATNMSIEHRGVAMRGYLWTRPSERRQGAGARLMDLQMDDFRARGVRAIHHFTDYASVPYRLYRKYGFESVEPLSGHMAYHSVPPDQFEGSYFEQDETVVRPSTGYTLRRLIPCSWATTPSFSASRRSASWVAGHPRCRCFDCSRMKRSGAQPGIGLAPRSCATLRPER